MATYKANSDGTLHCIETGCNIPASEKDAHSAAHGADVHRAAVAPASAPTNNELGELVRAQAAMIAELQASKKIKPV